MLCRQIGYLWQDLEILFKSIQAVLHRSRDLYSIEMLTAWNMQYISIGIRLAFFQEEVEPVLCRILGRRRTYEVAILSQVARKNSSKHCDFFVNTLKTDEILSNSANHLIMTQSWRELYLFSLANTKLLVQRSVKHPEKFA